LAVDLVRHGPLLEQQRDPIVAVGERTGEKVDDPLVAEARGTDPKPVFGHRRPAGDDLLHQIDDRRAEGDQIIECLAPQDTRRGTKKGLRRVVGEDHPVGLVADDHRLLQCLQHGGREGERRPGG
jgi:hypothetical protein